MEFFSGIARFAVMLLRCSSRREHGSGLFCRRIFFLHKVCVMRAHFLQSCQWKWNHFFLKVLLLFFSR